jgi:hypothetical protein
VTIRMPTTLKVVLLHMEYLSNPITSA